jgi:hypothetical protein
MASLQDDAAPMHEPPAHGRRMGSKGAPLTAMYLSTRLFMLPWSGSCRVLGVECLGCGIWRARSCHPLDVAKPLSTRQPPETLNYSRPKHTWLHRSLHSDIRRGPMPHNMPPPPDMTMFDASEALASTARIEDLGLQDSVNIAQG